MPTIGFMNFSSRLTMSSDEDLSIYLFSAVGADPQGKICRQALQTPNLIDATVMKENSRTGSCIVLSGSTDRAFISDRGCIDEMTLEWFEDIALGEKNMAHLHCAGYYNCTAMRDSWPTLLKMVSSYSFFLLLRP
jgi:sugar/nucleoside kinase (ribokinase family)